MNLFLQIYTFCYFLGKHFKFWLTLDFYDKELDYYLTFIFIKIFICILLQQLSLQLPL